MLEIERAKPMWICQDCVRDAMLKELRANSLEAHLCAACGLNKLNVLTPDRIASFIRKFLPTHFELDTGLYPGDELSLSEVVKRAIGSESDLVAVAVAKHLESDGASEEDFYWPGQEYARTAEPFESEEHEREFVMREWSGIALQLIHGRRFFNDKARQLFSSLLHEALGAQNAEQQESSAVMTTKPVGTAFYRARRASSFVEARSFAADPEVELGAPPKERAANNRMSAYGVPLMYVSEVMQTSITEIRPSIGDIVAVARFVSTRSLKFFDFNALSHQIKHEPLSFFDPTYQERHHHRKLLQYLHDEIARPAVKGDIDYVMTQALAEFIRYDKPGMFDGISFRSVQHGGGINFVLFGEGAFAEMAEPGWRPRFDLTISSDDVTFHEIQGITYQPKPMTISRANHGR